MRKRKTKRDEFLEAMDAITPWDEIVAMIEPILLQESPRASSAGHCGDVPDVPAGDVVQPVRRGG